MFRFRALGKCSAALACGTLALYHLKRDSCEPKENLAAYNYSRRFYPASAEYPDLSKHRNMMARTLTKDMYARLRDLRTSNGFSIDEAIQVGVDNSGNFSSSGVVVGDEEAYNMFRELFDKIIFDKHQFKSDQTHPKSDFDASKLVHASFDTQYVESLRIRVIRNIRGFCLPGFATRGEKRDVESILGRCLYNLDKDEYKGTYFALKDVGLKEEAFLNKNNFNMERPYSQEELSACFAKDWPDARGIWLSDTSTQFVAHLNKHDHIKLFAIEKTSDLQQLFDKFAKFVRKFEQQIEREKWQIMKNERLGHVTSHIENLGTTLKISARLKLPLLSKDSRQSALFKMLKINRNNINPMTTASSADISNLNDLLDEVEPNGIIEVSSKVTLGVTEVQSAQIFADAVNKLIEIEQKLEKGESIEQIFD